MTLFLLRHAKAGNRYKWAGDDADRPLSDNGWAQAEAVAELLGTMVADACGADLAGAGVQDVPIDARIVSSPYLRCRQTVEPLAAKLGLDIEADRRLVEGAWPESALELLDELPAGSVCCSHGDVIPAVIAALEQRGVQIESAPDWRKGSTWVLTRVDRTITSASVIPPP